MLRLPTEQQIAYQDRAVRVIRTAQLTLRGLGRRIPVVLDRGTVAMLPETAAHTLAFHWGTADAVVSIRPKWFHDPSYYQHEIKAAVESAVAELMAEP